MKGVRVVGKLSDSALELGPGVEVRIGDLVFTPDADVEVGIGLTEPGTLTLVLRPASLEGRKT